MSAKKVLIVDDSRDTGKLLATAVATLDATLKVKTYTTAEEALLELYQLGVDLLIVDIRLPGLSGMELARRARLRNQTIGIIEITGTPDAKAREQALASGANAFFAKPVPMVEFMRTVADLLGLQPPAEITIASSTGTPAAVDQKPASMTGTLPPASVSPRSESPGTPPLPERPLDSAAGLPNKAARLGDLLSTLRKSIGASLVALINDRGHMVGQTGAWPDPAAESSLIPALLPAIGSALRVSQQLGMGRPELVLTFRGSTYNLLVSPAGGAFAVLVMVKKEPSLLRTAIAVEEILSVQKDLERVLAIKTGQLQAPPPEVPMTTPQTARSAPSPEPVEEEQPDAKLAALLKSRSAGRLKPADIEAFWEVAADVEPTDGSSSPDVLSYEQATRLGLAPKDTGR